MTYTEIHPLNESSQNIIPHLNISLNNLLLTFTLISSNNY